MKKALVALVLVVGMFAFVGCGSSEEATEETTAETTAAETTVAEETTTAAGDIGVDKAKEIALQDAGIAADDANFTKANADIDDGINIYEVEFTSGETEYDYDIDAATGNILEKSSESIYDD